MKLGQNMENPTTLENWALRKEALSVYFAETALLILKKSRTNQFPKLQKGAKRQKRTKHTEGDTSKI